MTQLTRMQGWQAQDLVDDSSWVFRPTPEAYAPLVASATRLVAAGKQLFDVSAADFDYGPALLELRLPAVGKPDAKRASALFEQQVRCEQKLRDLAQHQAALRHQFWPLEASLPEARATP